jgi:putative ABC transport system permease protein
MLTGATFIRELARGALLLYPVRFRRDHRADFIDAASHLLRRESSTRTPFRALLTTSRVLLVDALASAPGMWMTVATSGSSGALGGRMAESVGTWLRGTRHDLYLATRSAVRLPALTLAIVGTLSLGIGVSTAVFDALDRAILHPLPFARSEELALVVMREARLEGTMAVPLATFQNWRARATSIRPLEVFRRQRVIQSTEAGTETLNGLGVSGGLPAMLGVKPVVGRMLAEADAAPSASAVVMLGESRWRTTFGADRAIVGRVITLSNKPAEIVGVWPAGARLDFEEPPDLVRPLPAGQEYRDGSWVQVIGRVRHGHTAEEVVSELAVLTLPTGSTQLVYRPTIVTPADLLLGKEFVSGVWLVFGGGLLLLGAAIANASQLLLERATERSHELGVRIALGASRERIVRMLLAEGVVTAVVSLGASALIAGAIEAGLAHFEPRLFVEAAGAGLGGRAFVFGAVVAGGASLICTLTAMVRAGRHKLAVVGPMRVTSAASSAVTLLVATQAAMAIVLACGAVLMGQSLRRLSHVDPGIDAERLAELSVSLPADRYPTPTSWHAYLENALERLRAVPGVAGATTSAMPLMLASEMNGLPRLDGEPESTSPSAPLMAVVEAPRDFLRVVGIRLRAGRLYETDERDVALVSESLARSHGGSVVGRWLYLPRSTKAATIVGVVGDVRYAGLADDESRMPAVYLPSPPAASSFIRFFVRTEREPADALSAARQRLAAIDRSVPILTADTGPEVIGRQTARHRFVAVLLGSLATFGFILAMSGIYGAVALSITRRRREIGVRMALGATAERLVAAFVAHGLRPVMAGAIIGGAAVWFVTPFLKALLFRVSAHDPSSEVVGVGLVLLTAVVAAIYPARRISRIDPAKTLRES